MNHFKSLVLIALLSVASAAWGATNKENAPVAAHGGNGHSHSHHGDLTVYCGQFQTGYSIFRASDNKDLGNAMFGQFETCADAARNANATYQDVFCAPYVKDAVKGYSAYRVSDGKDLGKAVFNFSEFESCQTAVRSVFHGIICLPYSQNGVTYFSLYNVRTGLDMGKDLYATLDRCLAAY